LARRELSDGCLGDDWRIFHIHWCVPLRFLFTQKLTCWPLGSAVYIFGIDQAKSQPDIAFTLGSIQSTHHYTGTERFVYNALFFSATGLAADATHTVNWIFNIDPSTGVGVQAALFDYAIVTSGTDDPTPNLQCAYFSFRLVLCD
jgi:hypothetical protein